MKVDKPIPRAPPDPPSPTRMVTIGTLRPAMTVRLVAIASLCPSLSASNEGQAPTVSISVTTVSGVNQQMGTSE
jgi:hypothetical protein